MIVHDDYGYEDVQADPEQENDPRRILDECWRIERRTRDAPYGERYVAFMEAVTRLTALPVSAWETFAGLYNREKRRYRPATGSDVHDWFSLVQARRG